MKAALYFLLAMVLSSAVSATELTPDRNVRLLIVNGEETKYSSEPVTITPGYTQIAVKAFMSIGRGADSTSFESDPFLLMFEAGEQDIKIVAPKFKKLDKAERHFKGQPDIKILAGGKELKYSYAKLQGEEGFLPFGNLDQIVAKYNQENDTPLASLTEVQAQVQLCEGVPNVEQLKSWFQKVSKAERDEFLNWARKQK